MTCTRAPPPLEAFPVLIDKLSVPLQAHLAELAPEAVVWVGIHSGGVWVAQALQTALAAKDVAGVAQAPLGTLNISFYRDDLTRIGLHPQVQPSQLPLSVQDKHVVLVDDVLQSGRTVRAAMNELFDYGRPASIYLAVLVQVDAQELPIQAQAVAAKVDYHPHWRVQLDSQLNLHWIQIGEDAGE